MVWLLWSFIFDTTLLLFGKGIHSYIQSQCIGVCWIQLTQFTKNIDFDIFKKITIPNFKYEPSDFNLMINDVLTAKIRVIQTTCKLDRSSILSTLMPLML
jgi:hypothetical protein